MKISLISIGNKRTKGKRENEDLLVDEYLTRISRFVTAEGLWVPTESAFWTTAVRATGRTPPRVILMDSTGRLLTSVEFAAAVGQLRDQGAQQVVFGIGGADGWGAESKTRADLLVSMGRMTLPHSLARVVVAEQIYRAMTILENHPYHCGH